MKMQASDNNPSPMALPRVADVTDSFNQQDDFNDEGTVKGFGQAVQPRRIRKSPIPSKIFSPKEEGS